jgi:hypothetical protein
MAAAAQRSELAAVDITQIGGGAGVGQAHLGKLPGLPGCHPRAASRRKDLAGKGSIAAGVDKHGVIAAGVVKERGERAGPGEGQMLDNNRDGLVGRQRREGQHHARAAGLVESAELAR